MGISIHLTQTGGPNVLKVESIMEAQPGTGWPALGRIMAPWAKSLGAFVIGVVSKEGSVARAQAAGCDAVLVWGACDPPAEVAKLTGGHKAHVVYDGIGKLTFATSLDCLRRRGLMISFGASSGAPDPVAVGTLNAQGSLFLTAQARGACHGTR